MKEWAYRRDPRECEERLDTSLAELIKEASAALWGNPLDRLGVQDLMQPMHRCNDDG